MTKPAISVLLPIYNSPIPWLTQAIDSILTQTHTDFELLLLDDGSNQTVAEFLNQFANKDARIRLIRQPTNQGLIATLNRGLNEAEGEFIARMDADDIAHPHRLKQQHAYLERHPDIFLVAGGFRSIDAAGYELGVQNRAYTPEETARYLLKSGVVHHPTVMFRNQGNYRYRAKALYCEDRDLWLRMVSDGRKLQVLPDVVLDYRLHADSVSATKYAQQNAFIQQVLKWHQQRLAGRTDTYDAFDPKTLLSQATGAKHYLAIQEMKLLFKSGKERNRLRAKIRQFMRLHGLFVWKPALIIYLLSCLPRPLERPITNWIIRRYE